MVRCLALPASAIVHTPKVLLSPDLSFRERLSALGMLYRLRIWRMFDAASLMRAGDSRRL